MTRQEFRNLKRGDILYISQGKNRGKRCVVYDFHQCSFQSRVGVLQLLNETYCNDGWSEDHTRRYSYAALSLTPILENDKSAFYIVLVHEKAENLMRFESYKDFPSALIFYDSIQLGGLDKNEVEKLNIPGCTYFKEDNDITVRIMSGVVRKD